LVTNVTLVLLISSDTCVTKVLVVQVRGNTLIYTSRAWLLFFLTDTLLTFTVKSRSIK
jgi:hypothetical protein